MCCVHTDGGRHRGRSARVAPMGELEEKDSGAGLIPEPPGAAPAEKKKKKKKKKAAKPMPKLSVLPLSAGKGEDDTAASKSSRHAVPKVCNVCVCGTLRILV
jgi:hypothetical protein